MGDFYELFFEDAVKAAAALDIALTKRGKHHGEDIPMCGVPVHARRGLSARLIRKGFRVAVCEQMEDPAEARKRGSKSVVDRDVVRVVTPGTLTEDSLLDARGAQLSRRGGRGAGERRWPGVDMSTGDFDAQPWSRRQLGGGAGARSRRGEMLVPDRLSRATTALKASARRLERGR